MKTFRLSPGIVSGHWKHDAVSNLATISLRFAGIEAPVELALTGDVPAVLSGGHRALWGYKSLPAGQEPNEAGAASDSVTAFVETLRGNSTGWLTRCELDDANGVEVTWRDERHTIVGNLRFAIKNPRELA